MRKLRFIVIAILLVNLLIAVTFVEEQSEENKQEITNPEIFGKWIIDEEATLKAAPTKAEEKLVKSFARLMFNFQADGTVEMAGGEMAVYTQISENQFQIVSDDTTLKFTLVENKLYAKIPVSTTRTIYPVFIKVSND